jgi:predicted Zn-dependent protease with MMP-like domain
LDTELFSKAVARALQELPEEFLETMDNVEVLVEDFPDQETLRSLGMESKWDLLGLYHGVPITNRSVFTVNLFPERIFLYRLPILRVARTGRNLVQLIREVVVHEVGHHFGFDDDQLDEMIGRHG